MKWIGCESHKNVYDTNTAFLCRIQEYHERPQYISRLRIKSRTFLISSNTANH
jgi:hypothetical protein